MPCFINDSLKEPLTVRGVSGVFEALAPSVVTSKLSRTYIAEDTECTSKKLKRAKTTSGNMSGMRDNAIVLMDHLLVLNVLAHQLAA